jgi:hypothetical protein
MAMEVSILTKNKHRFIILILCVSMLGSCFNDDQEEAERLAFEAKQDKLLYGVGSQVQNHLGS